MTHGMHSTALLLAASLASCLALVALIVRRRAATPAARTALLCLGALTLWTLGVAGAESAFDQASRLAWLRVSLLGIVALPGGWLLLALRHRGGRRVDSPYGTLLALAPALLFYASTITRDGTAHVERWTLPAEPDLRLQLFLLMGLLCLGAGSLVFGSSAVRSWQRGERRPALVQALALALPWLAVAFIAGQSVEWGRGLPQLLVSGSLWGLAATVLRYELLSPPPLGHREVIDHLRQGVLIAGPSGEVLDHNRAAEDLLAGSPRGRNLQDVLTGVPAVELGRGLSLEVTTREILGEDGQRLGQVATLRDCTDERRYAEAVTRSQKLETVGTLAAGIAHEVNNPLAFVRANVQEIARMSRAVDAAVEAGGSKLARDLRELGELAEVALEGLERIQRSVADVRRLAAAPSEVEESVSIDNAVLDALRLLEIRAGGPIRIEPALAIDLPFVRGSRQLLLQAIFGVLLHASRELEGRPAPRLDVATGGDGSWVWVEIRANGPCDARALAVEVATDIAREHGGGFETQTDAEGSRFHLRLPVDEDL